MGGIVHDCGNADDLRIDWFMGEGILDETDGVGEHSRLIDAAGEDLPFQTLDIDTGN